MNSASDPEHFVTLFDSHYLPLGLCLYRSLEEQGRPFHLFILAMDEDCVAALDTLALPNATVLRLQDIENDALRMAREDRSIGEYCWTLTPFLPSLVFGRRPEIPRVTYVDADVFFFQDPRLLLDELSASGKHVLITDHAFAPEYAHHARYGRFCVQFMTFRNTDAAKSVLAWWQARCLEWCYAREEHGKFGDQKYLDDWPERFSSEVHVLARTEATLAPWNVAYTARTSGAAHPVLYHFHSLRIVSHDRVVLHYDYSVGRHNRWIYDKYVATLRSVVRRLRELRIPVLGRPLYGRDVGAVRAGWNYLRGYMRRTLDWAAI
jgi:Nucleotide-diphospho-sugar transferase